MERDERIKQLKAELEALENTPKTPKNNLGFVAMKKLREALLDISVTYANIKVDEQDEPTIMAELRQINRASYTAICAIEQDITERN